MHGLFHALNIGTLATWISVAGFGTVGVCVPGWIGRAVSPTPQVQETIWLDPEITLGNQDSPAPSGEQGQASDAPKENFAPTPAAAPPELPELTELAPLPEIPDLPKPLPQKRPAANPPPKATASASAKPSEARSNANSAQNNSRPKTQGGSSGGAGNGNGTGAANGGMSNSDRLAAGRTPPPSYPAAARRKGQTGTVIVEFTVGANGRVISAFAKSPSPWPLLNEEAVRTVRRWKFPPGGIMKIQRPIVFRLK